MSKSSKYVIYLGGRHIGRAYAMKLKKSLENLKEMSRINVCRACNALAHGVKSRIALTHTCGRSEKEIKNYVMEEKGQIEMRKMWPQKWPEVPFINEHGFEEGGIIEGGGDEEYRVCGHGEWSGSVSEKKALDGFISSLEEGFSE